MALIKCSECGKDVSDKAAACPNCGAPLSTSSGRASQGHQAPVRVVRAGRWCEAVGALLVIAGLIAAHNSPSYNASKAAVWLLSKGIALHCAKQGLDIRSNSIHPTFIDTPILDPLRQRFGKEEAEKKLGRQVPLGHIGEPEDIANACLYLASDESKFMTGAEMKLDGGISAM